MKPFRTALSAFVVGAVSTIAMATPASAASITEIATSNSSFDTLEAALKRTKLDSVLNSAGSYTVFAPTDDAFAALPKGVLESLLENPAALAEVLKYHVAGEERFAAGFASNGTIKTLQGQNVTVNVSTLKANTANLASVDIDADNGVIHVIDSVLVPSNVTLPPVMVEGVTRSSVDATSARISWKAVSGAKEYEVKVRQSNGKLAKVIKTKNRSVLIKGLNDNTSYTAEVRAMNTAGKSPKASRSFKTQKATTITDIVVSNNDFSTLEAAVKAAGLDGVLDTTKGAQYTVFAPTNAAFAKIPADKLNALLKDKEALKKVLLGHVTPGRFVAKQALAAGNIRMLNGMNENVRMVHGKAMIDHSAILKTNIKADNGVIHVIDTVILP